VWWAVGFGCRGRLAALLPAVSVVSGVTVIVPPGGREPWLSLS
jgi:hypothetical protein